MDRRDFLASVAAAGLASAASLGGCDGRPPPLPPGRLSGTALDLGHRLRDGGFPPLNLETIDFLALYRNELMRRQAAAAQAAPKANA